MAIGVRTLIEERLERELRERQATANITVYLERDCLVLETPEKKMEVGDWWVHKLPKPHEARDWVQW